MRTCKKCGEEKELEEFLICRSSTGKFYLCGVCKDCDNLRRKNDYKENHDRELEYRRKYYQRNKEKWKINPLTDEQKKRRIEKQRERRAVDKRKSKANKAVRSAIDNGILVRPTICEKCNTENKTIVGHHPDYDKLLEVQWLCENCHSTIHGLERRIVPQNV